MSLWKCIYIPPPTTSAPDVPSFLSPPYHQSSPPSTANDTFSSPYNCSLPCPPQLAMPPWDVEFGWPQDVQWETRPCFECGVDKLVSTSSISCVPATGIPIANTRLWSVGRRGRAKSWGGNMTLSSGGRRASSWSSCRASSWGSCRASSGRNGAPSWSS